MPRNTPWEFTPIGEKGEPLYTSVLLLETTDVYVLWYIGKKGPLSLSELNKSHSTFPSPEKVSCVNEKVSKNIIGKPYRIDKSTLADSIKRLETKQLIYSFPTTQKRVIWNLAFNGLLWYLRNFWNQGAFKFLLEKYYEISYKKPMSKALFAKVQAYNKIIPFLSLWDSITKEFKEITFKALEKTVNMFYNYTITPVKIEQLVVEIQNYEEYTDLTKISQIPINKKYAEFLSDDKYKLLQEAYLSYRIRRRAEYTNFQQQILQDIVTETNNQGLRWSKSTDPIGLMNKLFPKYNGAEYFFTGMFVDKLLSS
jgi:hypothetical protein